MHRSTQVFSTGLVLVGMAALAAADIRVFVTPAAAGYGLTKPENAFRPTFSTVAQNQDQNAYDFSSGEYVCTSFPPVDAPAGTCNAPVEIAAYDFGYIWLQFLDEPSNQHIQAIKVQLQTCGGGYFDGKATYYVQNNRNAEPPLDLKRWDGDAQPPVYAPWHANPALLVGVLADGIRNLPRDPLPAENWNMYHKQAGSTGNPFTGVSLLGAVHAPEGVYEIKITEIYIAGGGTVTVSGGVFRVGPPPAMGACCFELGHYCEMTTEYQCYGTWYPNKTCAQITCEGTSGCCFPDGSCQMIGSFFCTQMGGFPVGPPCGEEPCSAWACCLPTGGCQVMRRTECDAHGGIWQSGQMGCVHELCPASPGDVDCSGRVDFNDINPFVLALDNEAAYWTAFPACNFRNADVNRDGLVNFDDINPFVDLLAGKR